MKKPQINLTRTSSFSQKASITFSNHCRFYCVKKLLVQKKKKEKQKLLKTDNKAIIERNCTTEHQWLKDVSYVKNTLYEHGCLGCQKYFQNDLMKLKSYQYTESPMDSWAPLNQLIFLKVKPTFHFLPQFD